MAYEKTEAVTETTPSPATITFWYEIDKLFNSVSIRTAYRAKMVKNQEGESQLDDIQLSVDEKAVFKEYLEQGVFDVFAELLKITQGVTTPIFFDTDFTPADAGEGVDAVKACGGTILDNASFNENIIANIDKKIENALRYFVLYQWYISCSMMADAEINLKQYKDYLMKLKNLSFDLRKPLMT